MKTSFWKVKLQFSFCIVFCCCVHDNVISYLSQVEIALAKCGWKVFFVLPARVVSIGSSLSSPCWGSVRIDWLGAAKTFTEWDANTRTRLVSLNTFKLAWRLNFPDTNSCVLWLACPRPHRPKCPMAVWTASIRNCLAAVGLGGLVARGGPCSKLLCTTMSVAADERAEWWGKNTHDV